MLMGVMVKYLLRICLEVCLYSVAFMWIACDYILGRVNKKELNTQAPTQTTYCTTYHSKKRSKQSQKQLAKESKLRQRQEAAAAGHGTVNLAGEAGRFMLDWFQPEPLAAIEAHVQRVHARALQIVPYKSVSQQLYLVPRMPAHFGYKAVVKDLALSKSKKTFLDVGCCMGTDLRKLALDVQTSVDTTAGVIGDSGSAREPANFFAQLFGAELEDGFIDLGFELFKDHTRMASCFAPVNFLDKAFSSDTPLGRVATGFFFVSVSFLAFSCR